MFEKENQSTPHSYNLLFIENMEFGTCIGPSGLVKHLLKITHRLIHDHFNRL